MQKTSWTRQQISDARTPMMIRHPVFPPFVSPLFAIAAGIGLYLLSIVMALDEQVVFISLSVLLLVYLAMELTRVRRVHPDRWLLNPAVFGSFVTFGFAYGLSNILFIIPPEQLELLGWAPYVTSAMTKLMWLVLLAAMGMWLGYWSPMASTLGGPAVASRFQAYFLPRTQTPRTIALYSLVTAASVARFLQVKLGVYGYSSTYERLIELGGITQYLSMAAGLGKLALILAALQYFSRTRGRRGALLFYGILCIEVGWGALSGFKSAVVLPFLVVALCGYLRVGKLPKQWLIFSLIGLVVAYAIIEPFRHARNEDALFDGRSLISIAANVSSAIRVGQEVPSDASLLLSAASRFNLSYIGSYGIEYADATPFGGEGDPEFLGNIFLAPVHALIPRFIWNEKPQGTLGLWYNHIVMGMSSFSSTAMGPVTYLYFAGGVIMVFAGFFFVGVVQRVLFGLLQPWESMSGAVVYVAMLQTVAVIDSAFNSVIISLFRDLPILIIVQFFLFKGGQSNKQQ